MTDETKAGEHGMNPWQAAIDDALVCHALDCTGPNTDPVEAVSRLLRMAVDMALDPAISERAQALIERGRSGAPEDELAERTAFAVWYGKHRAGIKGQTPIEAGEAAWQERARRADGVPREPLPAETAQPMFASHVGRRKWESLQGDGYRMQRIQFARSINGDERRGSIDPWGKVLWEPDGAEDKTK